jgi:hypothetical protein
MKVEDSAGIDTGSEVTGTIAAEVEYYLSESLVFCQNDCSRSHVILALRERGLLSP